MATDTNSNTVTVGPVTATIDTMAPAAPAVVLVDDTGSDNSDHITSDGNHAITGLEAGATVQYSTDSTNGLDGTWSTTAPTLAEGVNSFYVRQVDLAGNASTGTLFSFTLDTTPPVASDVSPSGNEDTTITITLAGADAGGSGIASYTLSSLPSNGTLYTD